VAGQGGGTGGTGGTGDWDASEHLAAPVAAGVRGADVRSDCWVELRSTPRGAAPARQIHSRVQALYGGSIRALVEDTLATLGASDLSVTLDDSGALPFTLVARLEAAVRRLRPDVPGQALPPLNPATRYPIGRDRLRRTRLYLPGNTPKFFINAGLHAPDAVILDLEDSVAPHDKDAARLLVRAALRTVSFHSAEKMVRINRLPLGLEDVRLLAPHGVHTLVIPKVEDADDVRVVHALLEELRERGELAGEIFLIPLLESARGVLAAPSIASAAPSVVALAIGLEDYTADIGAQRTPDGRESAWALGQILNAARAAEIQPLASIFGDVDDEDGLRAYAARASRMGFEGIGCIHPRQVRIVHEAFIPTEAEVRRASEMVARYDAALAGGVGVLSVQGAMVDAPVATRARRVLQRASVASMTGAWR
jgi:citrate lyase subunit beta/citryl-CoA lyase